MEPSGFPLIYGTKFLTLEGKLGISMETVDSVVVFIIKKVREK
jgi:hypothetical protein